MSDTLIGVIIGGIIATAAPIVVELIRGRREATLDKEKRADNRRIDRDALQRATLLEIMEAMADWKGAMTKLFYDQMTAYHQGHGPWPMTWSEANNARMDAAQTRVIVLRERVVEEHVRTTIRDTTDLRSRLLTSSSPAEALEGYQLIADGVDGSIEAAGEAIRSLTAD
jgi:hypothetical protein